VIRLATIAVLGAAAALAGTAITAKPATAPRTAITCTWPAGPNDSAASLHRRFGRQARLADIGIGEGETERGIVLYPNDPSRRIEVLFRGGSMRGPRSVRFAGERAPWTVAGIRLGDRLESVARRNGRAMHMQQFDADYGGTLHSFKGGRLETVLGRCRPSIVFSPSDGAIYPESLSGDGAVNSDHPDMPKAKARVAILGIEFPGPAQGQ
jgi:hypothetical protein